MHREEKFLRGLLTQPHRLLEYLVPERHWPVSIRVWANQGFLFFDNLVVDPKSNFLKSQHKTVHKALGRSLSRVSVRGFLMSSVSIGYQPGRRRKAVAG